MCPSGLVYSADTRHIARRRKRYVKADIMFQGCSCGENFRYVHLVLYSVQAPQCCIKVTVGATPAHRWLHRCHVAAEHLMDASKRAHHPIMSMSRRRCAHIQPGTPHFSPSCQLKFLLLHGLEASRLTHKNNLQSLAA